VRTRQNGRPATVYPRENEEFLSRHPKIQDVQVIGICAGR
jgi:acyl-CoA synthetase (AMP-forming)/AMP-acid ligase II